MMTRSPMLWSAGLACALGGAVAGTALGSTPVPNRPAIGAIYQTHEQAMGSSAAQPRALPDHYPLVTRDGIVPVEELSDRGLFGQARYRALYGPAPYGPAGVAEVSYEPDNADSAAPGDASLAIGDPAPQQTGAAEAPAPLALAAGPAGLTPAGQAKTIDVQAALAMR